MITDEWYRRKGHRRSAVSAIAPGAAAMYAIDEILDLADVRPMIAKPFSPGNAFAAEEVARERITFDKAMIGSCTNGSYDDLLQAALVLRAAREQGVTHVEREFAIFPDRAASAGRSSGRSAAWRRIHRRGLPLGRRSDPPVVVRSVLRSGTRRAQLRTARDHVVQSQLAESHGLRRRRLSREPGRRCRLRSRSVSWRRRASSD